jgi:hypothetical protein
MNNKWMLVIALAAGLVGGYFYGDSQGYKRAEADIKATQQASAQKAAKQAADAANPFKAANPLEGVEANPFEKTKKILNPFE